MKCPKCGANRGEKDNFCRNCGFEFTEEIKPEAAEEGEIPYVTLKKAKFYKNSLKVIFCVFTALALVFCALPVTAYPYYRASSVYGFAFESGFTDGLDGHWDNTYFILTMFANIFKKVDFVITPCALSVFLLFFCLCFSLAFVFVLFSKNKKTHTKAEAFIIALYALFIIIFTVLILGVSIEYETPLGAAPIMLLLLTLTAFIASLAIYIKRKKFFRGTPELQ